MAALNPHTRTAWQALVTMVHLVDADLDRQTQRDLGIPHSHYKILALLSAAPERTIGLSALAGALYFHKSRLSHALAKLESEGLVARESTPEPGRAYRAVLTRKGVALVRRAIPLQDAHARAHVLAHLSATQMDEMRAIAETVIANLANPS